MDSQHLMAYIVLAVYLAAVCGAGIAGAALTLRRGSTTGRKVHEHFVAGAQLTTIVWFFTMSASLFSGYTVSGIVAESYSLGWTSTRWIVGGVGVYVGFLVMAPRLHALGKSRGYMTISEFLHDRYTPPSGTPWVAHAIRIVSFLSLQLPVFTYLITQFQALGTEVRTFTGISATTSVLVAAAVLLVCDLMGGMRAVAYTDVLQGVVLMVGSVIFLAVQKTELGGLPAAAAYYRDPANAALPNVSLMQRVPPGPIIVAYFDFVFKTSMAATMFPHLTARLFASKSGLVMRRGMATMGFSFFLVQLSSMITGWVAISALSSSPPAKGTSIFGAVLLRVAGHGTGQAFLSALLLASAVCAMMSTADSALLAFSSMWVRDMLKPYLWPRATENQQIWFGRAVSVVGLAIGVLLGLLTIEKGVPNLTGLFSLQQVSPIHVVPSVWLGLHWQGLRGEAVLAGMLSGLAVTISLVFSPVNVKLAAGLDQTACGLSTAMIGFFCNLAVTVVLGVLMQRRPGLFGRAFSAVRCMVPSLDWIDVGSGGRCALLNPWLWAVMVALLLFAVPFYRMPGALDGFVGDMAVWAFVALLLSGVLSVVVAYAYMGMWKDWAEGPALPGAGAAGGDLGAGKSPGGDAAEPAAAAPPAGKDVAAA